MFDSGYPGHFLSEREENGKVRCLANLHLFPRISCENVGPGDRRYHAATCVSPSLMHLLLFMLFPLRPHLLSNISLTPVPSQLQRQTRSPHCCVARLSMASVSAWRHHRNGNAASCTGNNKHSLQVYINTGVNHYRCIGAVSSLTFVTPLQQFIQVRTYLFECNES